MRRTRKLLNASVTMRNAIPRVRSANAPPGMPIRAAAAIAIGKLSQKETPQLAMAAPAA